MLLEIIIPSFNGALYLEETLQSLEVLQSKVGTNDVQFKLYLNGSTDNSIDIAIKYQQLIANFEFIAFPENLGYDENLARALSLTSATYTLFLGDDDLILDNFYLVVQELKNSKGIWDLVHLNHIFIYPDEFPDNSNLANSGVEIARLNPSVFLRKHGACSGSLSSNIFLTSLIQMATSPKFLGLDWLHLAWVFKTVSEQGRRLGFFNITTVAVRRGNPRWSENFGDTAVVALNHLTIYRRILGKHQKIEYHIFRKDRFRLIRYNFLEENFISRLPYALTCLREFSVYPAAYLDFLLKLFPAYFSKIAVRVGILVKRAIKSGD
jgi:glycosyltransferase involved in cell wall biosynthesis